MRANHTNTANGSTTSVECSDQLFLQAAGGTAVGAPEQFGPSLSSNNNFQRDLGKGPYVLLSHVHVPRVRGTNTSCNDDYTLITMLHPCLTCPQ